jgi:hypothetical protein
MNEGEKVFGPETMKKGKSVVQLAHELVHERYDEYQQIAKDTSNEIAEIAAKHIKEIAAEIVMRHHSSTSGAANLVISEIEDKAAPAIFGAYFSVMFSLMAQQVRMVDDGAKDGTPEEIKKTLIKQILVHPVLSMLRHHEIFLEMVESNLKMLGELFPKYKDIFDDLKKVKTREEVFGEGKLLDKTIEELTNYIKK